MSRRIPNTDSPTEVRQAFQRLTFSTDIITNGGVGEVLIGAGIDVAPAWSTSLTTLTLLTVDNITIDGATITSDSGTISFDNENLTTTSTVTAGQILVDNLILDGATIESDTGAISFGDENLSTAGTITGINVTSGADPGHTHTGASVGGLDISSDTNLAVTAPIVLTDDTLSLNVGGVDHGTLGGLDGDDHAIYLLADGTRDLTGNLAVTAGITIDGRDISADWATLSAVMGMVKVDAAATAGYLGVAAGDGVLRTGTGLSYTDGGNFITVALDINSLAAAGIAGGDFVPFWDITVTATNKKITFTNFEAALTHANLIGGHNLTTDINHATITGAHNLTTDINHDALTNYVADKHVAHAGVEIATAATSGISGGGTIAATRNLALNINGLTGESAIVAADTLAFYDATAGANRKVTLTELSTALGAADEKVKVDVGATAGYLGVAAGDGVLRTDGTIAWTDGGNFVTLSVPVAGFTTRARGYAASRQDVPTGNYTKLLFGTEDYDGGGDFASSTFTAPVSGYYLVTGKIRTYETVQVGTVIRLAIYVNGADVSQTITTNIGASAYTFALLISDVVYVPSGQTIELYTYHNHGDAREYYSGVPTTFAVHRLS